MKIRSITCFFDLADPRLEKTLDQLASLSRAARSAFEEAGIEVQTTRLASTPFSQYTAADPLELAVRLEILAGERGFTYLSLGAALPQYPNSYAVIPQMLMATRSVFLSAVMATAEAGVDLTALRACAEIITRAAVITPDGFTNLRFAALANVPPFAPFFPAAYAASRQPAFALAIECADTAVDAFTTAESIQAARRALLERLNAAAATLTRTAEHLAVQHHAEFKGLDFSPAPFPEDWCSLGGALERLSGVQLGLHGSLAAAAVLADTLDQGDWLRAGFNGLMLPVLEDSVLARRTTAERLTLKDLLLYATVCGTGLDTVPLPGDSTPQQIAALLLDLAALAVRLDKPLTARLMPVPGKKAGEMTDFAFDFFANGQVMHLPAAPVEGLFGGEEMISLQPRRITK